MPDSPPAQLRKVHQPVSPAQIHKSAKATEAADDACAYLTFPQLAEQPLALFLAPFLLSRRRRQDQAAFAPVDLDDLDLQRLANKG